MRQEDLKPDSLHALKDTNCSYRTIQTVRCFSEVDEKGTPQQKCQRIYKKFKECPGRPMEVFEQVEDNVDPTKVLGSKSNTTHQDFFGTDLNSDSESLFSNFDGFFTLPSRNPPRDKNRSITRKLGDLFSFEKEQDSQNKGKEWKQFEKDFTEV